MWISLCSTVLRMDIDHACIQSKTILPFILCYLQPFVYAWVVAKPYERLGGGPL